MMKSQRMLIGAVLICLLFLAGCMVEEHRTVIGTRPKNVAGIPTTYVPPDTPDPIRGVGIESQDIVSMTDKMVRDMLKEPILASRTPPPGVIIDAEYFHNESASRINKNILTNRLRVNLQRAAKGRMKFIARHGVDMVEKERELKREGIVSPGTIPSAPETMGADYRLGGSITDHNAVDPQTGMISRYHYIAFEVVDLETAEIVWSGDYDFKKLAADDIIYR